MRNLNVETKKILLKRFNAVVAIKIVSGKLRYSELKYGSMLQNFLTIYVLRSFIAAKRLTVNYVFPLFNSSIVNVEKKKSF